MTMSLRMYHAGDGDCLLLGDGGGNHILVDGGRKGTFGRHTSPDLAGMGELRVVCVSHIDDDHINGILRLFEDTVEWKRHDFELSENQPTTEPSNPRPPEVREVWHNALFQLVGDDLEVRAQNALEMSANLLRSRALDDPDSQRADELEDLALANENIVNGERSGMELARRLSSHQLDIDVNDSANGAIMTRDNSRGRRIGRLRVTVLGPSADDITALRTRWQTWLDNHASAVDELRDEIREDESGLGTATTPSLDLGSGVDKISAPNLASIVLLVEQSGTSVLLTGDADSAEIIRGLEAENEMDPLGPLDDIASLTASQRYHCSVLKVQHHGAEANVTREFVARVSADNYVFCGNGAHHNPELTVVRAFADARRNGLVPNRPFHFWFSSSASTPGLTAARVRHMTDVKELVDDLIADSGGMLTATYMDRHSHLDVL